MQQIKITHSITNRDSQSLEKYLTDISKIEMVTADEEVVLAKRIREGDQRAFERLVTANLRFVVSVAKQYQNQGLQLIDLINEGNLGLIKAAQRFDETRGFKFISYAVWWIRQSILQALAENSRIVRLPLNRVGSLNKIGKAYAKLEQEFEREPTHQELAEILEISEDEIGSTLRLSGKHISMDTPFADGEDNTLLDVLKNDDNSSYTDTAVMNESLSTEVARALNILSEREREVIKMYFGIGTEQILSLEDIADKLDLTRERVRQIKDKSLRRLRNSETSEALKSYLA